MRKLFIVHTPYHLILAAGICKEKKMKNTDILIYNDFDLNSVDLSNINNLFENVYLYDKDVFKILNIPKLKTFSMVKSKLKNIKGLIKNKYCKIFVFNESLLETQYIIDKKVINNEAEIIYVEDGSNAYMQTATGKKNQNLKYKIIKYLFYGFAYEDVGHTFGVHTKIQKRLVVWPNIVREELKKDTKTIEEIKKEVLISGINACYKEKIEKIDDHKERVFILLEHLEFFTMHEGVDLEFYKEIFERIISKFNYKTIYIKYHPRDNSQYLKDLLDKYNNVKIVENSQPAEIYYISDNISIISVFSTTLFTATKILPKMNIISLAKIMNMKDKNLIRKFIDIGVKVPNDFKELMNIMNEN